MAREQERQGAGLLDVNIGIAGIDEPAVIKKIIGYLSNVTDLPLVVDSPRVETIEAALRAYPGRMLINSISGEREKLERLLPMAAKYGAMFVLLPLTDGEVPETFSRRKEIIETVLRKAKGCGFTKEDIIVDGLVMTVASNPLAPGETLKTVEWCSRRMGMKTVLGLSNVSFGLPGRSWVNSAFLAMAVEKGLTLAIANPSSTELLNVGAAADLLAGRDENARCFIARFSENAEKPRAQVREESPLQLVFEAVLTGDRDNIRALLDRAVASGAEPFRLVQEIMIPAITRVGELFDKREYFLPQLIAGAEAMKKGGGPSRTAPQGKTGG